ncbi:MAG TPA: hypothetical protein VH597_01545 [Verrucomicrobiae bacterium]|jgi:hypothetical protein|nr:hypothetical protein [Verrucomicrobiae bacterium]
MKISSFFLTASAALSFQLTLLSGQAAPNTTNATAAATNAVPKSEFTIPTSKTEGSDPFFPTSTRLWGGPAIVQTASAKQNKPAGLDCLVLKGLSGAESNRLAMINGRTMARGEDAEVTTDCGRILVHCVDITSNSAVIEVSGERRELKLRSDL